MPNVRVRSLTKQQERRKIAMVKAGIAPVDVFRYLTDQGWQGSSIAVHKVLDGDYRNDDIIAAFCVLTKSDPARMFPEPKRRGKP